MDIKDNKYKGFTLIEVIISIAMLSIILLTFLTVFGTSTINVFNSGNKNNAMTEASDIMELLYSGQPYSLSNAIVDKLKDLGGNHTQPLSYTKSGKDFNFHVEDTTLIGVKGYNVTIVHFYKNGDKYVELTSFVRGEN